MGNQCCSAQTQTKDPSTIPPIENNQPTNIEEDGGEAMTIKDTTVNPQVHANVIEDQKEEVQEQVQEEKENNTAVTEYKFKKQLESLQKAMTHVESLKGLAKKGAALSHAISEVEAIVNLFSQSVHSTSYLRDFKTDLLGLYGDLQGFRSFHLRYTLDDRYYNRLSTVSDVLSFLRSVSGNFTKDGKLAVDAFYKELFSGDSHSTFEEHKSNLSVLRDTFNTVSGQNFSTLPNYLYVTFNQQPGFALWTELFPNDFETSNAVFSEKYAYHCNVDPQEILSIISLLDSANDQRVDIYQWIDFVQEYQQVLDSEGKIQSSKLAEFSEAISAKTYAMQRSAIQHSEGVYTLPSGVQYTGDFNQEGQKSGKGKLQEEGYSFEGQFENDLPTGFCKESRKNVVYEGQFSNGLFHGQGTLTFPNGRQYKGAFANHQFHGEGTLVGDDGIVYTGNWKWGQLDMGMITYHDGSNYVGQLSRSFFKAGQGQLLTNKPGQSGTTLYLEGTWLNDAPQKVKVYNQHETIIYEGTMSNWSISGTGKRIYIDGSYEGELLRDKKSREGTLTYKNGDKFTGTWLEDTQLRGTYNYSKEKDHFYEGEFKNGVMEGKGKFHYASGGVYTGDIKDGKRHGQGVYKYKNGNTYNGQWVDGVQQGEGLFTYAGAAPGEEGDVYQGQFSNGKFNGFGHYIYKKTGKQFIGFWEDDRWNGEGKFIDDKNAVLKAGVWKNDKIESEKVEADLRIPDNLKHLLLSRAH